MFVNAHLTFSSHGNTLTNHSLRAWVCSTASFLLILQASVPLSHDIWLYKDSNCSFNKHNSRHLGPLKSASQCSKYPYVWGLSHRHVCEDLHSPCMQQARSTYWMSDCLDALAQGCLTQQWKFWLPWIAACWLGLSYVSMMLLELLVNLLMETTCPELKSASSEQRTWEAAYGRLWFTLQCLTECHNPQVSCCRSQT